MVRGDAGVVHAVRWVFRGDGAEVGDVHRNRSGRPAAGDDSVPGRVVWRGDLVQTAGLGDGADRIVLTDVDLSAGGRGMGDLQAAAGGAVFGDAVVDGYLACSVEHHDRGRDDLD